MPSTLLAIPHEHEKLAYSLREAEKATGLSRGLLTSAIHRGDLCARKLGRRTILVGTEFREFLHNLPRSHPK
jgi:hypothetical protein